jgi:hypothetical protein
MKPSYPRIMVALAGISIVFFGAMALSHADDYLVIKKKGGPTQKVPLNFSPEEIESFQVESAPASKPSAGAETQEPSGKQPGGSPMILKNGPFMQVW